MVNAALTMRAMGRRLFLLFAGFGLLRLLRGRGSLLGRDDLGALGLSRLGGSLMLLLGDRLGLMLLRSGLGLRLGLPRALGPRVVLTAPRAWAF